VGSKIAAHERLIAIAQLDLLHQIYGETVIPQAVYTELVAYPVTGSIEVQTLEWIGV
jgi:predicted nucleic acid-binding protein